MGDAQFKIPLSYLCSVGEMWETNSYVPARVVTQCDGQREGPSVTARASEKGKVQARGRGHFTVICKYGVFEDKLTQHII